MNVLLITYSFPPAGGVGVLRAVSLAKYLPESGARVDVLTARNAATVGKDSSLMRQIPAEVTVHRSWTLDLPFGMRKALKKMVSGGGVKAKAGVPKEVKEGGGNPLKRMVGNLLLPDPQVGWLPFALPAARKIIRERKIDVVVITVPPFSSVRLATRLRKVFPSLPIVVDFRDEWLSTTIDLVSFNKNDRARNVAHKAEAEAVRDSSAVVLVTEAARRELQARYPGVEREKFQCIPNGFDTDLDSAGISKPKDPSGRVVLTYIGTVYGSTDPRTFIRAVLELPMEVRARLKVRFIGHIETQAYREALERLGETVELKGFVPQAEALRAIEDTDYLLLITHDRINVAAKFYDYLGGGKPILGAVHRDGDVRRLLEETGAGWWANVDDVAAIKEMLMEAVGRESELGSEFRPDREKIAAYHRRPLAQRYAALLREMAEEAR